MQAQKQPKPTCSKRWRARASTGFGREARSVLPWPVWPQVPCPHAHTAPSTRLNTAVCFPPQLTCKGADGLNDACRADIRYHCSPAWKQALQLSPLAGMTRWALTYASALAARMPASRVSGLVCSTWPPAIPQAQYCIKCRAAGSHLQLDAWEGQSRVSETTCRMLSVRKWK